MNWLCSWEAGSDSSFRRCYVLLLQWKEYRISGFSPSLPLFNCPDIISKSYNIIHQTFHFIFVKIYLFYFVCICLHVCVCSMCAWYPCQKRVPVLLELELHREGSEPSCGSWEPHPGCLVLLGAGMSWAGTGRSGLLLWDELNQMWWCPLALGVKEAEKFKVIVNYVVSLRPFGAVRDCLAQPNLCRWSVHSNDFQYLVL